VGDWFKKWELGPVVVAQYGIAACGSLRKGGNPGAAICFVATQRFWLLQQFSGL